MANGGEDGNGLRYGFLKKRQDVSFSKVWLENRSSFAKMLQKCCCRVDSLQDIAFNHLVRTN